MHCYDLFLKQGDEGREDELFAHLLLAELELELQYVISALPGTGMGEKIREL